MVKEWKTIRIIVHGKVHGVFFRKYTRIKALELGIEGEVKNEPDGTVLIEATGTAEQLEKFIAFCRSGPPAARVTDIKVEALDVKKYSGFYILK